ncbi:hypothetical protein SGFS_013440 [Streptomyces graminofaciens]|uniref:Uncharacterized protein n=1 Tax=Streptomyces graminofaciens TaxID=68212 RepID=A0ABN5VBL0_9ACTN|nr:hypothetical protein [Streptomyces graminofaciens]BBC30050.1 hypothetical protein SGFS_013440 [Streptomyces graminofaciens]
MSFEELCDAIPEDNPFGVYFRQVHVRAGHESGQPGALAGDMTHEALPSWYGGITFRSKLEADWAATLDTYRVRWEYEPETITLDSGAKYIPDFRLPDIGAWLEVKGTGVPRIEKAIELGQMLACRCGGDCVCEWPGGQLVVIGRPPKPYNPWLDPEYDDRPWAASRVRTWREEGHPVWEPACGRGAWFTLCPDCLCGQWTADFRCRACRGRLAGGHAYQSGDVGLRFTNSDCHVAPPRTA